MKSKPARSRSSRTSCGLRTTTTTTARAEQVSGPPTSGSSRTSPSSEAFHQEGGNNQTSSTNPSSIVGGGGSSSGPSSASSVGSNGSMVNSPHHYVTITVESTEGVGGVGGGGGVVEGGGNGSSATSFVTYSVEEDDHCSSTMYATTTSSNGHTMAYPLYNNAESPSASVYSSTANHYSSNASLTQAYHQDGVYMVPASNTAMSSILQETDGVSHNSNSLAHATRVHWLLDNYERAEGVSLPRSTLYHHYLRHCSENKLDPINAASFGKLIRGVFMGLRTRRLGTRGNSKYHYYGIRIKPSSPLIHLPEDFCFPQQQNNHFPSSRKQDGVGGKRLKLAKSEDVSGGGTNGVNSGGDSIVVQQYLGDPIGMLDDFPELDFDVVLPDGLEENDLHIFATIYREHCESLLEILASFHLAQIESVWKSFWRSDDQTNGVSEYEKIFPKERLLLICGMPAVQEFVKQADYLLYQRMVSVLIPDVLKPIPSHLTQSIRNFSKSLEPWMTSCLSSHSREFQSLKLSTLSSLSLTLRRYTSLNHLAQAARAVLQNSVQVGQMLQDLNRVDFHSVEEQAKWVCGSCGDSVGRIVGEFKAKLGEKEQALEDWASWMDALVDNFLKIGEGGHKKIGGLVQIARQFLLKWSFYSSLVIRDLTLRSAASFGSFHLLRLLYDEYIFYVVEHRVAKHVGVVPIAVIGKKQLGVLEEHSLLSLNGGHCQSHSPSPDPRSTSASPFANSGEKDNNNLGVKREKHFL